jgi:hypothetical protein
MEGTYEFYPFCYTLLAADAALDASALPLAGRNYHYVTAVVFSAFAVEAAINHVGIEHVPDWSKNERGMGGWKGKLTSLAAQFGMPLDFTTGPAKTVKEAFDVRDKLAHGKTWVGQECYFDDGQPRANEGLPDWLVPCLNDTRVRQVIKDARDIIGQLLGKAGYPPLDLSRMGQGSYEEVIGPQAAVRPAVWKIKGAK